MIFENRKSYCQTWRSSKPPLARAAVRCKNLRRVFMPGHFMVKE